LLTWSPFSAQFHQNCDLPLVDVQPPISPQDTASGIFWTDRNLSSPFDSVCCRSFIDFPSVVQWPPASPDPASSVLPISLAWISLTSLNCASFDQSVLPARYLRCAALGAKNSPLRPLVQGYIVPFLRRLSGPFGGEFPPPCLDNCPWYWRLCPNSLASFPLGSPPVRLLGFFPLRFGELLRLATQWMTLASCSVYPDASWMLYIKPLLTRQPHPFFSRGSCPSVYWITTSASFIRSLQLFRSNCLVTVLLYPKTSSLILTGSFNSSLLLPYVFF